MNLNLIYYSLIFLQIFFREFFPSYLLFWRHFANYDSSLSANAHSLSHYSLIFFLKHFTNEACNNIMAKQLSQKLKNNERANVHSLKDWSHNWQNVVKITDKTEKTRERIFEEISNCNRLNWGSQSINYNIWANILLKI